METINERSKEAEVSLYGNYQKLMYEPDGDLNGILEHEPERKNMKKINLKSIESKFRKSPGWTISTTKESNNLHEIQAPQIRQFLEP